MTAPQVIHKTWGQFTPDDVFEMAVLRSEVFFLEQRITEEEFDSADRHPDTQHLWIRDDQGMMAYLRIVYDPDSAPRHEGIPHGLGRMVVRANARGQGLARALMMEALNRVGFQPLFLHAQDYVRGVYAKFGFHERGEIFMEAGIPHILMVRYPDA
jgi:ElaA protein